MCVLCVYYILFECVCVCVRVRDVCLCSTRVEAYEMCVYIVVHEAECVCVYVCVLFSALSSQGVLLGCKRAMIDLINPLAQSVALTSCCISLV